MRGRGDVGLRDAGTRGRGTQGRGDMGLGDVGTHGCHKQTTPECCAEFVIYNFRWSRGSMLESLPEDQ